MREAAVIFICITGMIVIVIWALTLWLAIHSGKGILGFFSRPSDHQWLSIPETIAQYMDDQSSLGE